MSCQAVWVQDPPHGLPAAATGSLQLQESCQGHSLEPPEQRTRSTEIETKKYCEKGRGHLHVSELFRCLLPSLKTVIFWFSLAFLKKKKVKILSMSKTERHSYDLNYQHTSTCTHTYINKDMHPHLGFPWTLLTFIQLISAKSWS